MPPDERLAFARRSWGLRAAELLQESFLLGPLPSQLPPRPTPFPPSSLTHPLVPSPPPLPSSPRQDAVSAGDGGQATLSALLDWLSGDVDARDHDGSTALHAAAEGGNLAAAALLLDRRASPGAATRVGETPLHFAAREGQPEVCRLLLDAGARADAPTRAGTTPVDEARRGGRAAHEEVRRLLDPEGLLRGEGPQGSANADAPGGGVEGERRVVVHCDDLSSLRERSGIDHIAEHVHLANYFASKSRPKVAAAGITHILVAAQELPQSQAGGGR